MGLSVGGGDVHDDGERDVMIMMTVRGVMLKIGVEAHGGEKGVTSSIFFFSGNTFFCSLYLKRALHSVGFY